MLTHPFSLYSQFKTTTFLFPLLHNFNFFLVSYLFILNSSEIKQKKQCRTGVIIPLSLPFPLRRHLRPPMQRLHLHIQVLLLNVQLKSTIDLSQSFVNLLLLMKSMFFFVQFCILNLSNLSVLFFFFLSEVLIMPLAVHPAIQVTKAFFLRHILKTTTIPYFNHLMHQVFKSMFKRHMI